MWGREFSIHFTASDAVTWLSPPLKRKALKKKKKEGSPLAMGAWLPTEGQTGWTAICRVHLSFPLRWTWALWKQTGDSFFPFQGPSPQPAGHHPGPRLQGISIRDIHSSHKERLEFPQICLDLEVPFLVRRVKGPPGQWPSDHL